MRWCALLLLLIAGTGCGGGAAGARAERAERGTAIVASIERAADEVCSCHDGLCADEAVERLRVGLAGKDDTMLTSREQAKMVRAVARLDSCRGKLIGRGEQAARVAERWATETCACADAGCRSAAWQRGADELKRYGDAVASEDELRRIVLASRRVRGCLHGSEATGRR